jgi:heme exporter protein B
VTRPSFFATVWMVARKDLTIEFRTRSAFISVSVFAVLGIVTFFFAWDPNAAPPTVFAPGVLWVIFTFSGLLAVQRSFSLEQADRAIDGLMLAPVGREAVFVGKALANTIFVAGVQLFAIPAIVVFYNLPLTGGLAIVLGIAVLATIGLVPIGTLFASMAANTRLAELLLPLLSLPFFVPIVITAANATASVLAGASLSAAMPWLKMLVAFDIVFLSACTLAFPYTLEQ